MSYSLFSFSDIMCISKSKCLYYQNTCQVLSPPSPALSQAKLPTYHAHSTAKSPNCPLCFYLGLPQSVLHTVDSDLQITLQLLRVMTKYHILSNMCLPLWHALYFSSIFLHSPTTMVSFLLFLNAPALPSLMVIVLALPVAWNAFPSGIPTATFV